MAGPRGAAAAIAASGLFGGVVRALEAVDRDRRDILPVLTYHRVAEPDDDHYPGLISASPEAFVRQIDELGQRFSFVGLDAVLARAAGGPPIPPRSLLITFDDAYRDFAAAAWPVLRDREIPVVLFVPTGFPDRPVAFWWDRLYAALIRSQRTDPLETAAGSLPVATRAEKIAAFRVLRSRLKAHPHAVAMREVDELVATLGGEPARSSVLGWNELRRLAAEGVTLAPHSRVHPLLERVAPTELDDEIEGSRADLVREIGSAPAVFAYPSGSHSDGVVARVAALGMRAAFTTIRGVNDLRRADWHRLRRINVGGRSSPALIRAQALGWLAR
ncbi:MAG: polysaccharide deacetylase family protein [Chloroflexota bacterium]|nr:polysaccharide deacetylase family protein [Chloroflexota bacterium]